MTWTRPSRPRWLPLRQLIMIGLALLLASGGAWAYWTADSVVGGGGSAAASTVNSGGTPTANAVGNAVTVSWAARTLTSGQAVSGYAVKRYAGATVQTILTACTGTIAGLSCVESNVPVGSWTYTATPLRATNWQGAESAKSTAVNVLNVVPSFTSGADQNVAKNPGAQTTAWATAISQGSGESGQAVTFTVTNSNNALFSVQPAISASGTLTYTPSTTVTGVATVSVSLHDDAGTANGGVDTSAVQTFALTVGTPPVLTPTVAALAYTENATPLLDTGITAVDADSTNLTSATVSMTTNYVNGQDTLAFTNQAGITGTWTAATGVLALSGSATAAAYTTALRTITYHNTSNNPSTSSRTVTFAATASTLTSATTSRTITVTAVNDAPVNSVPGSLTIDENTAEVFSSGNGDLISISDPDANAGAVQVQLVSTHGAVTLSGTSGLTFTVGDGSADSTMTFTGTVANINLGLAGLSFNPTANYSGSASLQLITNDQGNTGGGALTDNDTIAMTVTYGLFTTAFDVGPGAAHPTSSSFASSTYTEVGNGLDVYNNSDQFHYLYKSWTGNGTIIARVTSLGNTGVYARAGVMFRETINVGSTHAYMGVCPPGQNGSVFVIRASTGGVSLNADLTPSLAPTYWVKLVRSGTGTTFTGYTAPDNSGTAGIPGAWTQRGSAQTITMANTILVGLATLSLSASVTTTATYDYVTVS